MNSVGFNLRVIRQPYDIWLMILNRMSYLNLVGMRNYLQGLLTRMKDNVFRKYGHRGSRYVTVVLENMKQSGSYRLFSRRLTDVQRRILQLQRTVQ